MHPAPLLPTGWSFDWRSAVIGAVVAWLIAIFVYTRRASLRQLGQKAWAPIKQWRARLQRSTEEKYLLALREHLSALWLLGPEDPEAVFVPPIFLAPTPLPNTFTEEFDPELRLRVPYQRLLDGHSRVLITGARETGRTSALIASLWHLIIPPTDETLFTHFPVWIDLRQPAATPSDEDDERDALTWLGQLAAESFPMARPNWLASQLQEQRSLLLVDHWDSIPAELRSQVARRLGEAAQQLPNSRWLVATGFEGYGPLVEENFVPTDIQPSEDQEAVYALYEGWAAQEDHVASLDEDIQQTLFWALETGDSLVDLTLRIWLHLRTERAPYRMQDVLEQCVELLLPQPDLGEEMKDVAQQAQDTATVVLQELAWRSYMENQTLSREEIKESLLAEHLPPEEERPARLESAVLKMLRTTPFLRWQQKEVQFNHPVWEDLWLSHYLADTQKSNVLREHLTDPDWRFVIECYVGMAPAKTPIAELFKAEMKDEPVRTLLTSARWAVLAPEETTWRKHVMKALAQSFVKPDFDFEERLTLGKALALVAEESVHPFFLQVLRHPDATVRAAAFRGVGWTGRPRDVQTLAKGLEDEAFEVQTSAARALGDLNTPGAFRLLQDHLYKVDERLMLVIAETLAKDEMGWEALKQACEAEDLLVRRAAVHGLSHVEAPWTKEILEHLMKNDAQWLVRSAAEAALSDEEESAAEATVEPPPKLDEAAWLITWAAQQGLGVGLGDAALQMLLRTLDAEDPQARLLGCVTLGRIGRPEHLSALEKRSQDEERPEVKQAAAAAQRRIRRRYRGIE